MATSRAREWKSSNSERLKTYWKKYNKERDKNAVWRHSLKTNWNITPEQYHEILEKQNWCCWICQKHVSEFSRRLALDHDHVTGEIRGALCFNCNRNIIGKVRNPDVFKRAAEYLEHPFTGLFAPERKKRKRRKR